MEETGNSAIKQTPPVSLRILKGFWSVIRFVSRLIFGRVGMTIIVLLLLADFILESKGISGKILDNFQKSENGVLVQCRWIQAGVFKGIVLHGVSFDVNTKAGPLIVKARKANAQMNWTKIFSELGWVPNAVMVSGVKLELMGSRGRPVLACDVSDGSMVFTGDEQVRLAVDGETQGIKLRLEGTLTKMREFLATMKGSKEPVTPDPDVAALFETIGKEIHSFGRLSDDSFIRMSFEADCTKWLEGSMKCRFRLSDLLVNNVVVSKFRGGFEGGVKEISFDNVDVLLSRLETISAKGKFYPESREIEAELNGSVAPSTVCQLAGVDTKDWLSHRVRIPSLEFAGKLPRCELDIAKMSPSLSCNLTSSFEAFGVDVEQGRFNMSYADKKLRVEDISFWLSEDGRERLGGNLEIDFDKMLMAGNLKAELIWLERLRKYGIQLPSSILHSNPDPATIDITLAESPMDWRKMELSGSLEDHDLYFLTQHSQRMKIDFSFNETEKDGKKNDGVFKVKQLQVDLEQTENAVSLDASCDIVKGMDTGYFRTEFDLAALAQPNVKSAPKDGLTCNGTFDYWLEGQEIKLHCAGNCHPDWIYQSYCRQLDLSASYVFVLLGTGERPVEYTLDLPKISLEKGDKWKLTASVHGYDSHFSSFKVKEISCDVIVDSKEVDIPNIQAITVDDENLRLDIRVQYSPLEFSIKDLYLEGNPALAEAFILNSDAQEVYRKIWSEVKWSEKKKKPEVRMPTLIYKEGTPWSLTLTAHVNAQDVLYHSYTAEEMNLIITLDLPSSLSIKPITLKTQKGDVYGEVSLSFGGVPQCTFKIDGTEGYVNPKTLLTTVNRDFANYLADISFSEETHLNVTGEMFLSGDPRLSVSGSLNCPELKWNHHKLTDVEATWSYTSNGIAWNVTKSTFMDGKLRTSGVYEMENNRGEFLALIDGMPFERVGEMAGMSKAEERNKPMPGVVSGECHGNFLLGWAGRPLHLKGDGHVAIREADLWNVPLLAQLGELLPGGNKSGTSLGSITQLDADIEFLGNRLSVPQLYTNGTIMALRAKGEYGFEDEKMKFLVTGVPLQEVGILSLVLRPLTWAFQAELSGTRSLHKWRMQSGLLQLLNFN